MYKLLIADDEPLVCVGVQSMLDWAALGVEVVGTARNGGQAAEMIEQLSPDIVISDIKMPVKDGLALAQECNRKYGSIPVFIILTSYEDFEYARRALQVHVADYLIKLELDEQTLERAIKNATDLVRRHRARLPQTQVLARSNMQALREKFFIRLFNNLFDNEDMYRVQKEDLAIRLDAAGYIVASCELVHLKVHMGDGGQLSLYSSAMQLARETLERFMPCHLVSLDKWHLTIVFCLSEAVLPDYRSAVKTALEQTTVLLRSYLGITLHSSLGNVVNNPRDLGVSYRQSQRCAHGMTDADPVVFCDQQPQGAGDMMANMQELRPGIRRAFEELDVTALHESLSLVAHTYLCHPDDLLEAMDTTCNILYMAISLLPEGEALLNQIFQDEPEGYRQLYRLRDVEQIAAWVLRLRDGCGKLLQSRRQSYKARVVDNVKSYIQENLGKRLSLQEVAAVFNFNPNYLSHLFSRYAGESFVEYITGVRIAAARDMLARGEGHVYEIAEKLGFESSFYFSKVFKKVEGVSPREYRQQQQGRSPGAGSKAVAAVRENSSRENYGSPAATS